MAKKIGDVIPSILQQASKQHHALAQLERQWKRLVGTPPAAPTKVVGLRRGTLTVQTDEPGASFLLSLEKPRILAGLNRAGGGGITEIIVRPGGAA